MKRRPLPGVVASVTGPKERTMQPKLSPHWYYIGGGKWQHDETGRIVEPDFMIEFEPPAPPRFQFPDKPPRTMEELTEDERGIVLSRMFAPRDAAGPKDTAAACETARERVISAAVAYVTALHEWETQEAYAPVAGLRVNRCQHELIAAVEGMNKS